MVVTMMTNFAFTTALFTLIRGYIFDPKPKEETVIYPNYGYKNEKKHKNYGYKNDMKFKNYGYKQDVHGMQDLQDYKTIQLEGYNKEYIDNYQEHPSKGYEVTEMQYRTKIN